MTNRSFKLTPGLVSVTFRPIPAKEVIRLASLAEIKGIEWGSDIHLKPGDFETADLIRTESIKNGIEVFSYASYYHAGTSQPEEFDQVLETAEKLASPRIRVWAGKSEAKDISTKQYHQVIDDLLRISDLAKKRGIEIGIEYHGGTLTGTVDSTLALFKSLGDENIFSYWQPSQRTSVETNLRAIEQLGPLIRMVHCFHWDYTATEIIRRPLTEGWEDWQLYLKALQQFTSAEIISIEFIQNDDPDLFMNDSKTLRLWIENSHLLSLVAS
ncbi:MAG: TIM barrel protein [Verrucomicrobiota bacterium]